MSRRLRVLYAEDSQDDRELVERQLRREGFEVSLACVETPAGLLDALAGAAWDLVLTDHIMPELSSGEVVRLVRERFLDLPVIVVSGRIGEEAAVEAMRKGAVDYVSKDHLVLLGPAVRRALETAQARQASRAAREELDQFFELSADLLCVATADGRILALNAAWERILGWTRPELLGRDLRDLAVPEDRPLFTAHLDALARGGGPARFETRHACADGFTRWLLWTATHDAARGTIYAVAHDITERKRTEEALRASEERFARIVETVPGGLLMLDPAGKVRYANEMAAELAGTVRMRMLGQPLVDLFAQPGVRDRLEEVLHALARGRAARNVEVAWADPDGAQRTLSFDGAPLRARQGVAGAVVSVADVTDRRAADEARRVAQERLVEIERLRREESERKVEQLREQDEFRNRLVSTASHELRTPISILRLRLELLKKDPSGSEGQVRNVEMLDRNLARLTRLVDDMLDVGRLQSGRLRLEKRNADLGELAREAAEMLQAEADRAGVRLEVLAGPPVPVVVDPWRIQQVMLNLVGNALKFTPPGGRIEVAATPEGPWGRLRVTDSGRGLSQEAMARLFEPFSQVHDTGSGKPKGTGLGLFISKGIVEQHEGRISCESPGPGAGSTFTFELPLAAAPPSAAMRKDAPAARWAAPPG